MSQGSLTSCASSSCDPPLPNGRQRPLHAGWAGAPGRTRGSEQPTGVRSSSPAHECGAARTAMLIHDMPMWCSQPSSTLDAMGATVTTQVVTT